LIVDLVLNSAKAYFRNEIVDCSLAIDEGRIWKIGKETNMPQTDERIGLRNLLVLPGLIDAHVHLRDEGKAYKEDFTSGTAAAAVGGFTTVLDMPNNDPVTMSPETLRNRMSKAKREAFVNVGFFSEFPKKTKDIEKIVEEGAIAFKLFMAEQVGGLDPDDDSALMEALKIVSGLKVPVAVHAEDKTALKAAVEKLKLARRDDVEAFLEAHTDDVELKAVKRMVKASEQTNMRVHFCHVSAENGLQAIVEAKKAKIPVTCETTPHNLLLSADDLRRIGTLALTMPPVRDKDSMEALWKGVRNGWIDSIGSDHAPHALGEKAGSVWNVKVGIPGLETTLPLLLTEVKRGRLSIGDVVRLMAEKPAEIYGLNGKGSLSAGNKADLTIIDLNKKYKIDASSFKSKAKYSPFDGWLVVGKPAKTFINGVLVFDDSEIVASAGVGEIVRRA
jgi:dihydroorotase